MAKKQVQTAKQKSKKATKTITQSNCDLIAIKLQQTIPTISSFYYNILYRLTLMSKIRSATGLKS